MRILGAVSVGLSMMLSCARDNPAYGVSDADGASDSASGNSGTDSGTQGGTDSGTTSGMPTASAVTGPTQTSGGTSGMPVDAGSDVRCWSTPLTVSGGLVGQDVVLTDVPVMVDTTRFGRVFDGDNLRFYQDDTLLAHELEANASVAWVRLPELPGDQDTEFRAVAGAACDTPQAEPPEKVWSAGYVAVFHFDNAAGSPPVFTDSVHGIELTADPNTDASPSPGILGVYALKSGNGALNAEDSLLDLNGPNPLSTLGWVRLAPDQAGVLPWMGKNARHRELLAKLPGYRLSAVGGQVTKASMVQPRPFFNISEVIPRTNQDVVLGDEPLSADQWTLLAGTYDDVYVRLFVDGDVAGTNPSTLMPGAEGDGALQVGEWLQGGIDEIRISAVARTPDWIWLQYASMTNNLIFFGEPTMVSP